MNWLDWIYNNGFKLVGVVIVAALVLRFVYEVITGKES